MTRYLDPKNDLVFKRIFGEHPDLLISFLNALMPLEQGQEIESIEYLPAEIVPDNPLKKNSIVDVRCIDNRGRQFIVEMQMEWTESFTRRMVFNAPKAYVRQLGKGWEYRILQPVYGLSIFNEIYDHKTEEFYHHYQIINCENSEEVIEGLEFVFVELPKFRPEKWADRRMAVLWLRFLREMEDQCTGVAGDLLADKQIRQAVDICEEGAFTTAELAAYDKYWDIISTERTLIVDSLEKGLAKGRKEGLNEGLAKGREEGLEKGLTEGLAKGREEGLEKGLTEGLAQGEWRKTLEVVSNSHKAGIPAESIALITGLATAEVNRILAGEQDQTGGK
jgi:predicted transposase/invertase (TIGR01784 family)